VQLQATPYREYFHHPIVAVGAAGGRRLVGTMTVLQDYAFAEVAEVVPVARALGTSVEALTAVVVNAVDAVRG
jgi:hypothetical protein